MHIMCYLKLYIRHPQFNIINEDHTHKTKEVLMVTQISESKTAKIIGLY